jgi:hypothetical protein
MLSIQLSSLCHSSQWCRQQQTVDTDTPCSLALFRYFCSEHLYLLSNLNRIRLRDYDWNLEVIREFVEL